MQIIYGGVDTWDALAYGEQNPINNNYFRNQIATVSNSLNEVGRQFFSDARDIYERFNGSAAMQAIRTATKAVTSMFQPNVVRSLFEISDFQNATLVMQRWIMANPVVRQTYHDQKCDGYSDTYVDMHPGAIGENHYDYRRVMDGIVQDTEDDGWKVKFYPDELAHGDRELFLDEKVDILTSWEIIQGFMKIGKADPTSQYGNNL